MKQSLKTTIDRTYAYTIQTTVFIAMRNIEKPLGFGAPGSQHYQYSCKRTVRVVSKVAGKVLYILQCMPRVVEIRKKSLDSSNYRSGWIMKVTLCHQ